jgi:hypothetical protein
VPPRLPSHHTPRDLHCLACLNQPALVGMPMCAHTSDLEHKEHQPPHRRLKSHKEPSPQPLSSSSPPSPLPIEFSDSRHEYLKRETWEAMWTSCHPLERCHDKDTEERRLHVSRNHIDPSTDDQSLFKGCSLVWKDVWRRPDSTPPRRLSSQTNSLLIRCKKLAWLGREMRSKVRRCSLSVINWKPSG